MAKKQAVTQADIDAAGHIAPRSREVIYSIIVPGCDDMVKIERTRRTLSGHGVQSALIHIDADRGVVSVPRLFTLWQGDEAEQAWQRAIQTALPGCLIDVADWAPAPGYPQGELGTVTEVNK